LLDHNRPHSDMTAANEFTDANLHDVAAAQLAVYG
jgi:hypothetical protein